jgi:hypothetical protein
MYRTKDMELIMENLDRIKDESAMEYKKFYEPTIDEIGRCYQDIKLWIKQNKKIAYGGFAQNLLLTKKNPDESFYKVIDGAYYNWPDVADIEFYSPTPIQDAISLTEYLFDKGYKHIEAKSTPLHEGTYKIFVNFLNYSDISYMPNNIYNRLPTIDVDGIRCAHPHFMMVDAYRIINDPMTSYWRLDKPLKRFPKILNYYPIQKENVSLKMKESNKLELRFIRKKIIHNSRLIVVGMYAYNYYVKKEDKNLAIDNIPYYELISEELRKDAVHIYKLLTKKFKNITVKEYSPFWEFMDRRVEYYSNGSLILTLYGPNDRCTVYNFSQKKKTYFGTYSLVYMYLLFNYFYNIVNNNKDNVKIYLTMINNIMNARNKYLDNKKKSVLDKTPFQEMTYKCFGIPVDPKRMAFLERAEKKEEGKRVVQYNYTASGKPGNAPDYVFSNISGNPIVNEKYQIIKKN